MKITIEFDAKALVDGIMENFPEYSQVLKCTRWKYADCLYTFVDSETGKEYTLDRPQLESALQWTLEALFRGEFPSVGKYVLRDFQDAGSWDATAADILVQFACFGTVLYG